MIFDKKQKDLGAKSANQQALRRQDFVFLVSTLFVAVILIILVISRLNFLLDKINKGIRIDLNQNEEVKRFDIDGFNKIKDKITSSPLSLPQ